MPYIWKFIFWSVVSFTYYKLVYSFYRLLLFHAKKMFWYYLNIPSFPFQFYRIPSSKVDRSCKLFWKIQNYARTVKGKIGQLCNQSHCKDYNGFHILSHNHWMINCFAVCFAQLCIIALVSIRLDLVYYWVRLVS